MRMTNMPWLTVFVLWGGMTAAQEPPFDIGLTVACLAEADPYGNAVLDCVGRAADACMAAPEGGSTVGMGYRFEQEWQWWDWQLTDAYSELIKKQKRIDDVLAGIDSNLPSLVASLKEMQRAWIPFRDATCDYEGALWGGGLATARCTMTETARQELELRAALWQK